MSHKIERLTGVIFGAGGLVVARSKMGLLLRAILSDPTRYAETRLPR